MILKTDKLVKRYKSRTVVNGVSVSVKQGEIVGLLGPNGAGKTTTFYMIVGLIKPNEGDIYLDSDEITNEAMYRRAKRGIGYLPQEASVFRKLSVEDNIRSVLQMTKLSKTEQKEKLEALLDEFGLQHIRKNRGDLLSGGERRRTEIARSLAVDPKFILLDEPFAGVDPIAVEDIQTIVSKLKKRNIGVLITDHNVQETLSITDRAYLLFEGNLLKAGTAEELAADEQVRKVYLGKNFELRRVNLEDADNKVHQTLAGYEEFELAAMYRFKYESYTDETKAKVDSFLERQFLTPEILDTVWQEVTKRSGLFTDGQCNRCGSKRISRIHDEQDEMGATNATAKRAVVDAIVGNQKEDHLMHCSICGNEFYQEVERE